MQLKRIIHLITPLGHAEAHFQYIAGKDGIEWGCFQNDTGEYWVWPNRLVRQDTSITEYRYLTSPISESNGLSRKLAKHRIRATKTNG